MRPRIGVQVFGAGVQRQIQPYGDMTTEERIDKAALELVHELLSAPEGTRWFVIVRAKLARLVMELRARKPNERGVAP
jgi:hypothetical protein